MKNNLSESELVYISHYNSPVGFITIKSDGEVITELYFDNNSDKAENYIEKIAEIKLPIFNKVKKWLDEYFAGYKPNFDVPLKFGKATDFRKRVWKLLLDIPYGEVTTYGAIAKRIEKERGKRVSAQAVGGAVGHNPIAIIVPCHRVIGSNGSLIGYAGGIDKKLALLELEGNNTIKQKYGCCKI